MGRLTAWAGEAGHALQVLRRGWRNDQIVLWVLAVLIGALAGYGALAFRELVVLIAHTVFGRHIGSFHQYVATLPFWHVVLAPTLGGLIIGLFVHYAMPGRRPQGVADVIEAAALRSGRMGERAGLGSALVSAASIGVGASVGREGPVVHLGAALGSWTGRVLHLGRSLTVTLLGCGTAAAIAASFNAPIAGVLFALEVVIGHYALSAFAPIVVSAVVATVITRTHFGNFPAFSIPDHGIASYLEFPAFLLLGVVAAIQAVILLKSVDLVQNVLDRLASIPRWACPALAGLCVGIIALAYPHVLGVGYDATDAALKGQYGLGLLLILIIAKTAATAISLGGGFGGGIFSPALFLGALVGSAYGIVATGVFPSYSSGLAVYSLIGMGSVAGAVLGAPISTILIIFELTGDYALTIAVMVGVVTATAITRAFHRHSFFTGQLARRGLTLKGGREVSLLSSMRVRDVMRDEYKTVLPSLPLAEVRQLLVDAPYAELFVVAEDGKLVGTIELNDLSEAAFDTSMDALLNAADVTRRKPPVLAVADDLRSASETMERAGVEHIAVVDDRRNMRVVGFAHQIDVMAAYNRALIQARAEERGEV